MIEISSITRVFERLQRVLDGVVAYAAERHRADLALQRRVLRRSLADLAHLARIDIADEAENAALQLAERVAEQALDAEFGLDLVAQQVGERAGAGELHAAMRRNADERRALEQLCHYITRPAPTNERAQ